MFESLRWRIAFLFLGLSATLYVGVTALGLVVFQNELSSSLDEQLRVVLSEIGHAIDVENGMPHFRNWIRKVETEPPRSLASIQLFDKSGKVLEHYGARGVEKLFLKQTEVNDGNMSVRVLCSPVLESGVTKGYVQVQLSTRDRDEALIKLRHSAFAIGVLFLLALSALSYWIAKLVTRPVQQSIEILKSFVADAGHELNTPITILQTRIESLERKLSKLGMEDQEDLVVAGKSLARLNHVVNDLLLLSEVEDPISGISKNTISVASLIQQIELEVKDRYLEKGISLTIADLPESYVKGNWDALHRLFSNLVENALRYTDKNGEVRVSLSSTDRDVCFGVKDTGIGIPEEALPHIFERFFRVDKSRSRASGGTGLGLAIAKAIVDAHGGAITVESILGSGTNFVVSIPKLKDQQ